MWNLSYTAPTFLILILLLIYYCIRPKLHIRTNQTFFLLLLTDAATLICDLAATRMDETFKGYPVSTLYLANILYFAYYIMRSYLFYRFTVRVLDLGKTENRVYDLASTIVLVISEAVMGSSVDAPGVLCGS